MIVGQEESKGDVLALEVDRLALEELGEEGRHVIVGVNSVSSSVTPLSTSDVVSPAFFPNRISVSRRSPTMQIWFISRFPLAAMLRSVKSAGSWAHKAIAL